MTVPDHRDPLAQDLLWEILAHRHLVPRLPPRIEAVQERKDVRLCFWNGLIRASRILTGRPSRACPLASFRDKALDDLEETKEPIESAVRIQPLAIDARVLAVFIQEERLHAPARKAHLKVRRRDP